MRPQKNNVPRKASQGGLGLVEIMVGLLIGMLATIVIFQVFSLAERQKRTTTGAADAQTNSAFALYAIERDTKMAGFGIEADTMAACNTVYSYVDDGTSTTGIPGFDAPAAISITDGGGSAADQVQIIYYSDPAADNFSLPSRTTLRGTMSSASATLDVYSAAGCVVDKLAMLQQGGKCTIMQITQVQGAALKVWHDHSGAGTAAHPVYNPDAAYMTAHNWPVYSNGAVMRCGLEQPVTRTYRLNAGGLESLDSTAGVAQSLAPNIVALQAQYGVADAGGLAVNRNDQWTDATGAWGRGTLTQASGNGKRIKAIRIALVARSSEYEKPTNGVCATTTDAMVNSWSSWANLSAVKNLPDWQCYRYKVVETVIPLRNVIWANTK